MGAFVGYFLFGHLSMKTNMENLQAIHTKMVCSTRCGDSGKCQTFDSFCISVGLLLLSETSFHFFRSFMC